jgi:hypothetical protein
VLSSLGDNYLHISFSALYKYIQEVGPSISYVSVFIGMNGSSQELGLKKSNTWAFLKLVNIRI